MKRGCPVPPFRLVISMRTHVVDGWRAGTSILRQRRCPLLIKNFTPCFIQAWLHGSGGTGSD